jgi:hypothetical protein
MNVVAWFAFGIVCAALAILGMHDKAEARKIENRDSERGRRVPA